MLEIILIIVLFVFIVVMLLAIGIFFDKKETVENSKNELEKQKKDYKQKIDSISEDCKLTAITDETEEKDDLSKKENNDENRSKRDAQTQAENSPKQNTQISVNFFHDFYDLEELKKKYKSICFYIDEFDKDPCFELEGFYHTSEMIDNIESLFYKSVEIQSMATFMTIAKSYLWSSYFSEKSIEVAQLNIKANLLEYATHGELDEENLIKSFICLYENAKMKSSQDIDFEINSACASMIQILKNASELPYTNSMKQPEDILNITEVLLNLYCLFPISILDDYLRELTLFLLDYELEEANDIIEFYEECCSKIFNHSYVNIDKLLAFDDSRVRSPKLDSAVIKYFDEKHGICIVGIEFIETPYSNITFNFTVLDANKNAIPFNTTNNDFTLSIPYVGESLTECGPVCVEKTIFGCPKEAKFIEVKMNLQKTICGIPQKQHL